MGAVNYFTSDYITIAYDISIDVADPEMDEEEKEEQLEIMESEAYEDVKDLLNEYDFYYYHVEIKPGYYEGFSIMIENNFSVCYNDYIEKKEAQKEITQIKDFLVKAVKNCNMLGCYPGWCIGWDTYEETLENINIAIKSMRIESMTTPTWSVYAKEEEEQHDK